jgi:WD40 repeat protein
LSELAHVCPPAPEPTTVAPVWAVAFDRTGRRAASGHADGRVLVWDVATGRSRVRRRHADAVRAVAFTPGGAVISASADGTIHASAGVFAQPSAVWAVDPAPDGANLLSGAADGTVRRWDAMSGTSVGVLAGHTATVAAVVHAPGGREAISGSGDATACVWDLPTGTCTRVLRGHEERVWDVAYRADGARVLTASADGTVRVWDTATWRCLRVLDLHRRGSVGFAYHPPWVTSVAFLDVHRHALLGAADGSVQIWDTDSGERVRSLTRHADGVLDVAVAPSGHPVALSASLDGDLRAWDLASGTSRRWAGNVLEVFPA